MAQKLVYASETLAILQKPFISVEDTIERLTKAEQAEAEFLAQNNDEKTLSNTFKEHTADFKAIRKAAFETISALADQAPKKAHEIVMQHVPDLISGKTKNGRNSDIKLGMMDFSIVQTTHSPEGNVPAYIDYWLLGISAAGAGFSSDYLNDSIKEEEKRNKGKRRPISDFVDPMPQIVVTFSPSIQTEGVSVDTLVQIAKELKSITETKAPKVESGPNDFIRIYHRDHIKDDAFSELVKLIPAIAQTKPEFAFDMAADLLHAKTYDYLEGPSPLSQGRLSSQESKLAQWLYETAGEYLKNRKEAIRTSSKDFYSAVPQYADHHIQELNWISAPLKAPWTEYNWQPYCEAATTLSDAAMFFKNVHNKKHISAEQFSNVLIPMNNAAGQLFVMFGSADSIKQGREALSTFAYADLNEITKKIEAALTPQQHKSLIRAISHGYAAENISLYNMHSKKDADKIEERLETLYAEYSRAYPEEAITFLTNFTLELNDRARDKESFEKSLNVNLKMLDAAISLKAGPIIENTLDIYKENNKYASRETDTLIKALKEKIAQGNGTPTLVQSPE